MAFDTREKRASIISTNPGAPPSPTPNVAMDQEWRQEAGWGYAGILVGVPIAVEFEPLILAVRGSAFDLEVRVAELILRARTPALDLDARS